MAIPIGRFYWDLWSGDPVKDIVPRAKNYVKKWGGKVACGDGDGGYPGDSVGNIYFSDGGPSRINIPAVSSTSGLIWYSLGCAGQIGVTLGPKDTYARFARNGDEYCMNPYSEDKYVSWVFYWGSWYNGIRMFDTGRKCYWAYQSFGSNTYTINRRNEGDPRRLSTLGVLVTKGTHLATGKASTLVLLPQHDSTRNWDSFQFWIWNPVIDNWITGAMKGIKQSMQDSSHVLITPIELNGYTFPEVFFADATSNPAFGAYCAPEQLREYEYSIKSVKLNDITYYVPISHSEKTIILIKKAPDGISIKH